MVTVAFFEIVLIIYVKLIKNFIKMVDNATKE